MEKHPIGELMETTMSKIRQMVDANTVIGQPITAADGIVLVPVSKVTFGFASGGSDFSPKQPSADPNFGGGAGAGVKITPVAFLVIKNGEVSVLSVTPPADTLVDKLLEGIPELAQKISALFEKKTEEA